MLKIAVCDDEQELASELGEALGAILGNLKVRGEIDLYFSADDLCRRLKAGAAYDMLYLDIRFAENEINGIQAGHLIREALDNTLIAIVFISWEKEYAHEVFDLHPLHFLPKPLPYDKIEQTIKTHLKLSGISSGVFTWQKGRNSFKVRVHDIVYLENRERKVIMHFADGSSNEFYGSLKALYDEQLQNFDFLFIHASYLVNYDYVTEANYDSLLVKGIPALLPVSKNRRGEIRRQYTAIMKRRRGM